MLFSVLILLFSAAHFVFPSQIRRFYCRIYGFDEASSSLSGGMIAAPIFGLVIGLIGLFAAIN